MLEVNSNSIQLSDAHMSVLSHCLAGRCQRHSNSTSGWSISCTSIQRNIMLICNSRNLSLVRFHRRVSKSFKQLCWWNKSVIMDQKPEINISQGSVATVCRWSEHVNKCYVPNYFTILSAKYYGNRLTFVEAAVKTKHRHEHLSSCLGESSHCTVEKFLIEIQ